MKNWSDTLKKERTELEQLKIEYKMHLKRLRQSLINTISGDSVDWDKGIENVIRDIENGLDDLK